MSRSLRVLCIHGVGGHPPDGPWQTEWSGLIRREIRRHDPQRGVEVGFVCYDDLFGSGSPSRSEWAKALRTLVGSSVLAHRDGRLLQDRHGPGGLASLLNLTAGMVVKWAGSSELRDRLRRRVVERTRTFQPDVVAAHSLGSLIAYDAFSRPDGAECIRRRVFLSFGSQIGHRVVRGVFAGRFGPLEAGVHRAAAVFGAQLTTSGHAQPRRLG